MDNQQIAVVFEQIAQLLEIQGGNPFRIRSYQRASELLQQLSLNIAQAIESQPVRLSAIPGLGKGTLSRIKEIVETGACRELQQLTAQIPLSLLELRRLRHLGPVVFDLVVVQRHIGRELLHQLPQALLPEGSPVETIEGFRARYTDAQDIRIYLVAEHHQGMGRFIVNLR